MSVRARTLGPTLRKRLALAALDKIERFGDWSYRRRLRNLTEDEYLSCCSCGREGVATRQYFDNPEDRWPSWMACDTCHNEDTPHGHNLRHTMRSEPIPPLEEARRSAA